MLKSADLFDAVEKLLLTICKQFVKHGILFLNWLGCYLNESMSNTCLIPNYLKSIL